jgi:hypothetical protein
VPDTLPLTANQFLAASLIGRLEGLLERIGLAASAWALPGGQFAQAAKQPGDRAASAQVSIAPGFQFL